MKWAGTVPHKGELRNTYKMLAGKPEGGDSLGNMGIDKG
jgi:hypothetical protein